MWLIPLFGLILGALIGSIITFEIPVIYAKYMSIAVLASLDSAFGGVKAVLEGTFNGTILMTGFFTNTLIAALLAFLGDKLGVDLYLAAVFAFGVRLFQNLASIRHYILMKTMKNYKGKK